MDSHEPRAILEELVGIDSVSHRSNRVIADLLEQRVTALGFRVVRHAYSDESGAEKVNLVANLDGESAPSLALVGHTDTVPFDPSWPGALDLEERDGRLYGRGACDTKGFIACALAATSRARRAGVAGRLALVFTADEEIGCVGAARLAQSGAVKPKRAIVGEPTELVPIRAHKGYALARVRVIGREGHSAYPAGGSSAILAAGRLLSRIEDLARALTEQPHADFDPPHTTLNVGKIEGGQAANVIAGLCELTLEWRPVPGQAPGRVLAELRTAAREVSELSDVRIEVTAIRDDPGVETSPSSELVRFLETQTGQTAATVSFGTEAPHFAALGAEAVVFGPGDIRDAHKTGESVAIADLERCTAILEAAILRFCS